GFGCGERCFLGFTKEPEVATHQPVGVTKSSIQDELAAEGRNPPQLAAKAFNSLLKPIAKVGDFATQAEVIRRIDEIEAGSRGECSPLRPAADEGRRLKGGEAVLGEPRYGKLHACARAPIGSGKRVIAARADETIHARFAVAQDRARAISCRCASGMLDPPPV